MRMLLQAGPRTVGYDSFTDANGTALTSHAMDLGPGWSLLSGTGTAQINANRARLSANGSGAGSFWTFNPGQANVRLTTTLNFQAAADGGIVFRVQDASNFWFLDLNTAGAFSLYERSAGSDVQRASASVSISLMTDYTIQLTTSGQVMTALFNGVVRASYVSGNLAGKAACGVFIGGSSTTGLIDHDNFRAEALP